MTSFQDNENLDIKTLKNNLYSIYKTIYQTILKKENIMDINKIKISELILYTKSSINNIIEFQTQTQNYLIKLEADIRQLLKREFQSSILKISLESKIRAYMNIEEDYQELKEKVHFSERKFLENDRKDNEIIILRRENSTLKKEIANLENKNKKYENKNAIYKNNIKELQKEIQSLNKKISDLEKSLKENKIKNNLQKNLTNSNSCSNLNNENILEKMDNNNINGNYNYSLKNIRNLYNNNNNKNLLNTLNTNNFVSTFSKKANGINYKKIKIPIKNEFTFIKESRNNSISVIHKQKDESKINLANRKFINKIEKYPNLIKPENKTRNIKEFLNLKPPNFYPLTSKNDINLIPKYIQREFNNNSHNLN